MKKLIVTVVGLLMVVLLIGGCGLQQEEEYSFYLEHYRNCVDLCQVNLVMNQRCGKPEYKLEDCINRAWMNGCTLVFCEKESTKLKTYMVNGFCDEDPQCSSGIPLFKEKCK